MINQLLFRFRAYFLVAPLAIFVSIFFIWPLATVFKQAISDPVMTINFPLTNEEIVKWDKVSKPPRSLEIAFMKDLQRITDNQVRGEVIRKLNSQQAGFRTLMSNTVNAVDKIDPASTDYPEMTAIDKRWAQPLYWNAVARALPVYTDQYLLSAIDMERDKNGSIHMVDASQSANMSIMARTLIISLLVTLLCIIIGLPYAMIMASVSTWKRQILLAAVLLPLWTSLLVRTSAWYVILQDSGLINTILMNLNLIDSPLHLLFNRTGVVIAMVHVLLPLMVLPIYGVLLSIPKNLMPAAASLGAHPIRAFLRVLLPLSLRGVAAGGLLVFISAIGYYITPALIGGPSDQMLSSIIAFYALNSANWGMASALGAVLLVATLILYTFYNMASKEKY